MFGWLRQLLTAARPRRDARQIFRYWDGAADRRIDPVLAWQALDALAGGEWQDTLKAVAAAPPPGTVGGMARAWGERKRAATLKLADMVAGAFGVVPFDGSAGLTVAERVALAASFLDFMGGLAAAARGPTTSPSPTA